MTTTVTVNAHCDGETTRVQVVISEPDTTDGLTILQNGESCDFTIYDAKEISVKEIPKPDTTVD